METGFQRRLVMTILSYSCHPEAVTWLILPDVSIQDGCTRHDFFKRNGYFVHLLETLDLGEFLRELKPRFRKLRPIFRKLKLGFPQVEGPFPQVEFAVL